MLLSVAPVNNELPEGCPELPLKEVKDAIEFENFLKLKTNFDLVHSETSITQSASGSEKYFERNVFNTVGGYNAKDCTKRLLAKIISNELALKYNWKGSRGEKLPFSSLVYINKLISGAVRGHKDFKLATDIEITSIIKTWLYHSKDRDGSRRRTIHTYDVNE